MIYERKIVMIGNASKGIILPPDLLAYLELNEGDEVCIQDEVGNKGKYFSVWKKVG